MATDILVPQLGNEVTEAEITEWIASAGDHVKSGEVLVVISTTKTALEIESPVDGTLSEILVNEGELTEVGSIIGVIE
ncbi:biotin-binding protein [Alphaproteobacteria bacterium]|nr:biotin-binding protein [Alphaproteobacteria bacterium]MDC3286734.1 biotin-binding protein [Alphaproteobacteria bacterium]